MDRRSIYTHSQKVSQLHQMLLLITSIVDTLNLPSNYPLYKWFHLPIIELAMYVCMYVSHVLDRKLLERLMSPSPKSQVMFASAFSWIGDFFRIFGIHISVMASLVNLV